MLPESDRLPPSSLYLCLDDLIIRLPWARGVKIHPIHPKLNNRWSIKFVISHDVSLGFSEFKIPSFFFIPIIKASRREESDQTYQWSVIRNNLSRVPPGSQSTPAHQPPTHWGFQCFILHGHGSARTTYVVIIDHPWGIENFQHLC